MPTNDHAVELDRSHFRRTMVQMLRQQCPFKFTGGQFMAHGNHHRHHQQHGHHFPPGPTELPAPPPAETSEFAQLGAVFNDATRALVGGLWQTDVEEAGQGNGSVFRYVDDLNTVKAGIQAGVDAGTFTGATLSNAQAILNDIDTAISAANASVNGGGEFGSVAAAETALHDSHLDVLKIVSGDATLSALAAQDGANGFAAAPPTLDGVNAKNAPHATLAEIGAIFDDAANRILGGVNADNKGIIADDVRAVIKDMKQLIADHPDDFTGLTGVHADTVVRQLHLELDYLKQADTNPVAGRGSNDNILDIIDIVQGDENLAQMANQNGVSGFTPFPDALNETPKYLDNEAQTNFWANFIADSNSFADRSQELVGSGDKAGIQALIAELRSFEKSATEFDAAQGGIFGARFDNELLGKNSTLGAEVNAMIKGLKAGDADLVLAAGIEMHTNAADVGGNNLGFDGTIYNTDGRTVAEVLSLPPEGPLPAIAAAGAAPAPAVEPAAPNANNANDAPAPIAAPAAVIEPAVADVTPAAPTVEMPQHHFEHVWG
jgi:hypothetical protein